VSDRDPAWAWEERRWRAGVEKVRAGRPLRPVRWKDGARVCVALSFDPDHETSTLRDGSVSPGRLSQGEYGSRVAVPRILDLLKRHHLHASFFVPAVVALLHPDEQRRVVDEGHEIGMHGWIHEWTSELPEPVERDLMRRAYETLTKVTGRPPVGVRVPSWDFSPSTLTLIRELGLLYAPYLGMNRGSAIRPYTAPSALLEIFKAEFDGAVAERGLFLLTMHPHIIGHRSRIWVLEELIQHIKHVAGVWFATHEEVARYCKANA
jgi:peptidoglycan/xylan/chitin deacetylase (PgdA/CDA1 family)